VNLALFLASRRSHVTAAACREAGLGYPEDQDDAAFLRMFERDKDALRAAGLVIEVRKVGDVEAYRVDADASFAREVPLDATEIATLRAVAAALAAEPGFPFADDLVLALSKLGATSVERATGTPDSTAAAQARDAQALAEAVQARKTARFGYTNRRGEHKRHTVDPYGLFFREGDWYLVGLDRDIDEVRTYAVGRIDTLEVNSARPHTPDFEAPAEFDVREYERLPFQYGNAEVTAVLRFDPDVAGRAPRLARGHGALAEQPDGSVVWTVGARDLRGLAQWIVDEGPGIRPLAPADLIEELKDGLERVVRAHG
jgi:proteasome accessory factor B